MKTNDNSKKITIVQQAYETVPGFMELFQRFKQKLIINGGANSTLINYGRQLGAIALF